MDSSFRKCHKRRSFLPKHSSSSLIGATFTFVGVGINFKTLDDKETSNLDKILVDKLMTFGITNLPFQPPIYNLSNFVFSYVVLFTNIAYVVYSLNTIVQFRTILVKGIIQSA